MMTSMMYHAFVIITFRVGYLMGRINPLLTRVQIINHNMRVFTGQTSSDITDQEYIRKLEQYLLAGDEHDKSNSAWRLFLEEKIVTELKGSPSKYLLILDGMEQSFAAILKMCHASKHRETNGESYKYCNVKQYCVVIEVSNNYHTQMGHT